MFICNWEISRIDASNQEGGKPLQEFFFFNCKKMIESKENACLNEYYSFVSVNRLQGEGDNKTSKKVNCFYQAVVKFNNWKMMV